MKKAATKKGNYRQPADLKKPVPSEKVEGRSPAVLPKKKKPAKK